MRIRHLLATTMIVAGATALSAPAWTAEAVDERTTPVTSGAQAGGGAVVPVDRTVGQGASEFRDALGSEYDRLAEDEFFVQKDDPDYLYFVAKADASEEGWLVLPDTMNSRDLDIMVEDSLEQGRLELVDMLDNQGRELAPAEAARAQVAFDCWMEQMERAFPSPSADQCRDRFETALADAREQIQIAQAEPEEPEVQPRQQAAAPPAPPEPTEPGEYRVLFDFDKADLDPSAERTAEDIAEEIRSSNPEEILIVGHTDTAGPEEYNDDLSRRRADTVRDRLISSGVDPNTIRMQARGEEDPAVALGDDVPAQVNRRVIVRLNPQAGDVGVQDDVDESRPQGSGAANQ